MSYIKNNLQAGEEIKYKADIHLSLIHILGAGGMATMWEAIFADVGVALLAIFNAMRIQK